MSPAECLEVGCDAIRTAPGVATAALYIQILAGITIAALLALAMFLAVATRPESRNQ